VMQWANPWQQNTRVHTALPNRSPLREFGPAREPSRGQRDDGKLARTKAFAHSDAMKPLAAEIDRELDSLDEESARRFTRAVRAMLQLAKSHGSNRARLGERLANHPAIGSWPADRNIDQHVDALRAEWER
jgi:hypothetical protein